MTPVPCKIQVLLYFFGGAGAGFGAVPDDEDAAGAVEVPAGFVACVELGVTAGRFGCCTGARTIEGGSMEGPGMSGYEGTYVVR